MTDHVFESRIVQCKKPHVCNWCGELIDRRCRSHFQNEILDGEWHKTWMHVECNAAFAELCSELRCYSEPLEYYPGQYKRGSTEEC